MSALTGKTVAGFELLEELGRGGMGVVYKARQLSLDRIVAIKFLPTSLAKDEKKVQRFIREARAAGKLSHPNIVAAYDVGQASGVYYIAMEYVNGQSAYQQLKHRGVFVEDEVIDIGMQAAQALRAAHAAGILHRDVKPDNFLMDNDGTLKLADLGLARFEGDEEGHLTQDGTAMGSPHYMSPEAARGAKLDARSDLYSLGASLYLLASNLTPFKAPTSAAIMVKVISESPRPLAQVASHLSTSFIAVVEKLMAKDPAERFQSADEVISALKKVKSGPRVKASADADAAYRPAVMPTAEPKGATPVMFAALGGVLAVIVLGLIIYGMQKPVETGPDVKLPVARSGESEDTPDGSGKVARTQPTQPVRTEPVPPKPEPDSVVLGRRIFEKLALDHRPRLRRDPVQLIEEWEKLIRENPDAPFVERARRLAADARVAADARLKDWQEAKDRAAAAGAKNDVNAVAAAYLDFIRRNPETPEAREAEAAIKELQQKILTWVSEQTAKAKMQAAGGDVAGAMAILDKLKSELPPKLYEEAQVAAIVEAIQKQQQETEGKLARLQEADGRRMQEAHAKAQTYVAGDASSFQFPQAADVFTTAGKLVELDQTKADAKAWAERYTRAGKVWDTVRERAKAGFPNEFQTLGRYKVPGKVSGAETRGLSYSSPKLPAGGQLVPYKDLTPENVVELAKQVGPAPLDLGLLAYAVGAVAPALELLDPAKFTNETEQALAKGAYERLKQGSREQLAQTALANAQAAKERNDAKAAGEALQAFGADGPLADTEFARSHAAEITAVKEWTEKSASKTTTQTPAADTPKAPEKTTPETIAELKKLGWDSVEGLWVPNPEKKGMYKVTNGKLIFNGHDAVGTVVFQLAPGGQLSLLARNDQNNDLPPLFREGLRQHLGETGTGYGAVVGASGARTFEPFNPPEAFGRRMPPALQNTRIPVAKATDWPVKDAAHSLTVQTQGENVNVEYDRQYRRAIQKVRPLGNFILEVQGTADVQLPQVRKL